MFELNGTLVIFVLSFLVFMYLLNEIMLKPVGRVLELRAQKIKSDQDAASSCRAQAEEAITTYEKHLHEIRLKAQATINHAVVEATNQRNQQLKKVAEVGHKRLEQTKSQIASERDSLLEELIPYEVELINETANKLLGQAVLLKLDKNQIKHALEEAS